MAKYDLVVIGSGPAGEKGAAQAAYFGKKVALVEKASDLGGAAANTGTLPSKTLRETALYLSGFRQRGLHGVTLSMADQVSARDFLFHQQNVTGTERARIQANLERHKVDRYKGFASFTDPHAISVAEDGGPAVALNGDVFLIATGSRPHRPGNFPFQAPRVYDSDTILAIRDIPQTMLIAGGGVIGCEYACLFQALGVQVTLVEGRDRLLQFLDAEISQALAASMSKIGIRLLLNETIDGVEAGPLLNVRLKSGKAAVVDTLLAAAGRSGNTAGMNLEAIGVTPGSRGQLDVNAHYQTSVAHVYAAGDVIGFPALASTSMEQARVAMVHAFDLKYKTAVAPILPYGIYTIPECSVAGETEESLQKQNIPYVAGRARYEHNPRGQIIGDRDGFLKLLFREEDMRLLGVSVIGEQATELIHVGLTALLQEATAELFIQTCFNYPTLSELYKYATYDALGERAKRQG
ncbi:MAG: pyruvate/2-oxoglutarate dehydrogenase complex, dihydrolipoamide dehydrogenase component [Bryobacterales bacterium]|nr:pyruvate/2-oxoglutarate dehydrogenase complex, dihydrolipoamide dehydrogenase component [Bryobacterales bacterium]